jgi:pSer/pThr/pTyr-binding forkhead associated (FHA) protein
MQEFVGDMTIAQPRRPAPAAPRAAAPNPAAQTPAAQNPAAPKPATPNPASPAAPVPPAPAGARPVAAPRPAAKTPMSTANLEATPAEPINTLEIGGGTIVPDAGGLGGLAADAFLRSARPRLVITAEGARQVIVITKAPFTIGRGKQGVALDCTLNLPAVSGEHARVLLRGMKFYLEDLNSKNKTFVDSRELAAGRLEELSRESHVRLGTVDALFVVDVDAEQRKIDPVIYAGAAQTLENELKITRGQRENATRIAAERGLHVGEVLLEQGLVTVEKWKEAFERYSFMKPMIDTGGGGGAGMNRIVLVVVALVVLAGVAFFGWKLLSGGTS